MLPIERDAIEVQHFDTKGRHALTLYLDTDPSRGAGRNLRAQIEDVLRPIRVDMNVDDAGQLKAATDSAMAQIAALESLPRAVAVFVCPELEFLRIVPLPEPSGQLAHWGPELFVKPLVAALDEHERTIVALVDKEHAHVFRVFLGQIEEVAHFTEEPEKHTQAGYAQKKVGGGSNGASVRMGYGESNLQRRHDWHVRRHLERVLAAVRLEGGPSSADRFLLGGGEETVFELLRLLPKRIRERTRLITGIPVDTSTARVLARVIETQYEAEREEEQALLDALKEHDHARAAFGAAAVAEAVSDARVHTLVYGSKTEMEGAECNACGWLVPGAAVGECPRCSGEMRAFSDLVERLVSRVLHTGGRVEEVRGPALETLLESEGLAALLRYVPAAG